MEKYATSQAPAAEPEASFQPLPDMAEMFADGDDPHRQPVGGDTQVNSTRMKELARKRHFYQLAAELSTSSDDTTIAVHEQLSKKATTALAQAKEQHARGKMYQEEGHAAKALDCFKTVQELVADYPDIMADISATEDELAMLEGLLADDASVGGLTDQVSASESRRLQGSTEARKRHSRQSTRAGSLGQRRALDLLPYLLSVLLLATLASGSALYFTASSRLSEARQLFAACASSFADGDFQAAQEDCNASLRTSETVYLLYQGAVAGLQADSRHILDSEEMQQGLQGKVLYNGRYISSSALSAHQTLQELLDRGDMLLEDLAWEPAADTFQQALTLYGQLQEISAEERAAIEQRFNYAAFMALLTVGEKQVDNAQWPAATATLTESAKALAKLPPEQQEEYRVRLATLLESCRYNSLKQQADTLFSQADWSAAASLFQQAAETGQALLSDGHQELSGIKRNMERAKLYAIIEDGNTALARNQWNRAIEHFTRASVLLRNETTTFSASQIEQSGRKLDRSILQAAVSRDRQNAARSRTDGNLEASQNALQQLIDAITTSPFADEPTFKEVAYEARTMRQEMQEEVFLKKKQAYLTENFLALFMKNYRAAAPESLGNPQASFVRRLGRHYLFQLQCTERGQGRPMTLIMYYTYNPDNQHWQFYPIESEKRQADASR
ncbi:MAG: hypothetical protein ACK5PS_12015 [Desulfopila sp.]